jgi:valyl-tRNA synthetase
MEMDYKYQEVEPRISHMWEKGNYFTPKIIAGKKPFSIFLTPPNASGEMHIGNALAIAIQDILARYHRAMGIPTLWIPSTDHGGYETQVTFERELERAGKDKSEYDKKQLFTEIEKFVEINNEVINRQIKALGASVDWSRSRYTMDDRSLKAIDQTFKKMVADYLIYRRSYMTNYCPACGTILADIELKEREENAPLYFIKFTFQGSDDYLSLATLRPEFLFTVTHVLIHPADTRFAHHIGKFLNNPVTGDPVEIVASKRKFDPQNPDPYLYPFSPSCDKYDYEYTMRNAIPARSLLDWQGNMIERYPGLKPAEARVKEVAFLMESDRIEKTDDSYLDTVYLCKRGHAVESMIMLSWFLKMDDEKIPLRKIALEAIAKDGFAVLPRWREKGLTDWLKKMHDWPIARQNVWGIKVPIFYDVSDPSQFVVWFIDHEGKKRFGNLKIYLDRGVLFEEISAGLQRIYAAETAAWTLEKQEGKLYLPETDTFDTWFSSGQWGTIVYDGKNSDDFSYFYPSDSMVIGHDLLRLSVSRKILLSLYLTGKLPFKLVYLHRLIKGNDGQKMSKSLGNSVSLDHYLDKFGADVTRLALTSHTTEQEDFILAEEDLIQFRNFSERLWRAGRMIDANCRNLNDVYGREALSRDDRYILSSIDGMAIAISSQIKKYFFASAQDVLCNFIFDLEKYISTIRSKKNKAISLSVLNYVFKKYIMLLHPFMPFMTEELYCILHNNAFPLAASPWPDKMNYFGE